MRIHVFGWRDPSLKLKEALDSAEDDKAPGPDGFPLKLLKVCWDVVGKDVMAVFEECFANNYWCKSLSATFITLIPKGLPSSKIFGLLVWLDAFISCWRRRWQSGLSRYLI